VLRNLATVDWEAGRLQEAVPGLARALAIERSLAVRGLVGLSHRQKLAFLGRTNRVAYAFMSVPPGLAPNGDAYRVVLDRKNLLFRTLAAERSVTESNPTPQTASLMREYTTVRRQLAALALSVPNSLDFGHYRIQFASLSDRLEALESDLSRTSDTFRLTQAEAIATFSTVCAGVPLDAAHIEFFWYERYVPPVTPGARPLLIPHYVAFVLRGGACNDPVRADLGPAAPIDEDVRRFRDATSRDTSDPKARELRAHYQRTLAARLKAKLFPPEVQHAIKGKPRLFISPDASLTLFPFALLPGDEGHEFLLETRTISYVPSGRDLLRPLAKPSSARSLLAVGSPIFDHALSQVSQATAAVRAGCGAVEDPFTPLPGTGMEVQAIAEIYEKSHPGEAPIILAEKQATKAAFLGQVHKASILHLATHAYFAGEECTPAGLAPTPQRTIGDTLTFLGHNPLLLAGIALAGANEREKADGILTALEITALDLRGTDLVVLSACDTGLGTVARGQELLGLRWAFAYAGVKSLVTSLWSVPDAETATLMTHFYTGMWEKGLSVPAALRAAQLEMLKAARARGDSAPHAWGAFVASGQPD